MNSLLPEERVLQLIHKIRDQKVMLDSDLAEMYGVETRVLKQAVRRNPERFPDDFMFELTEEEWESVKGSLRSQIVILKKTQRGKHGKYLPFVFTEQGVSMLSSVLNSPQAIQVNISIVRVFVKMREWSANYSELLAKINELQQSESEQNHHIGQIYQIIEELLKPSLGERKEIGFKSK